MKSRAISVHELLATKFDMLKFTDEWQQLMGTPERSGVIFIWGDSGHGKTWFSLMLARYLTTFANKVVFNTLEEGKSYSQQLAWEQLNMLDVASKIMLLDKEPLADLEIRLAKHRSADIVFLDSWQYVRKSFFQFYEFLERFKTKLFVVISQEQKGRPKGKSADDVRFHAMVKLHVKGFVVFPQACRYGGNIPFIIDEEKARQYHGDALVDEILKQKEQYISK